MFIYTTTLASPEKLFSPRAASRGSIVLLPTILIVSLADPTSHTLNSKLFIEHIFSSQSAPILIALVIFLLRGLFAVVKLSESFKGTLLKLK